MKQYRSKGFLSRFKLLQEGCGKSLAIVVILLFMPMWLDAGNAYREIATKDKLTDKDLTFAVTFDEYGVNADFAKGNPVSTTMKDVGLMLRGCIGFDTKPAFKPNPGEDLKFEAVGNASPHNGTLVMWVDALDYAPSDEESNGKKRGNIALLHMMFKQDSQYIEYKLYEYGDTVYFDWWSSEPPHGWGQNGRVQASRKGIDRNQWHQIAVTWDDKELVIYLNGELIQKNALPFKVSQTAGLVPQKNSFIGIKSRFYEDKHTWDVGVDDLKIFSRVLSPLEIKNQYAKLLIDKSTVKIQPYGVKLNGVDTGWADNLDQLEVEFDFSALPESEQSLLNQGKLAMKYCLLNADKTIAGGQWTFSKKFESKIIKGVELPGTYHLETSLGKSGKVCDEIVRPDLSFAGNGIGDEDIVPDIWKDFAVKSRTVTLWNRIYEFGEGPLPAKITAFGDSLLKKTPQLIIETPRGVANIRYETGPTKRSNCAVTFTGTGKTAEFTLDYATTVEFDGLIKFDFTIKGAPEINSMRLEWQVNPEVCQYLMTPILQEGKGPQFEFPYPVSGWLEAFQLWLVSEDKGGFAHSMTSDANWVYDPVKPVFFVDKGSGQCSVTMITKSVKMPENTPYQALFIATPTRPLPKHNRVIRFFDSTREDTPRKGVSTHGEGLTGSATFEPHETDFAYRMKNRVPNTLAVYGTANALTDASDMVMYFKKYWDIPGACIYKIGYYKPLGDGKYGTEYHFTVPACNACHINDYFLYNIKKLFNHPYGDRICQIYYDLCENTLCGNDKHGCSFKDKFGRTIKTFALLNKRKLVERTVRFCHAQAQKRTVMLHAQREYSPFLHGLADYYFPGEQHSALIKRNPFGYTEVSDTLFRSEYNRNVLGVGVVFLPVLGVASGDNFKPAAFPYTEAMMTMLLSHDVETSQEWAAGLPIQKVWNALEKYGVQSPETRVHLYYNQHEVTSSSPDIRVTWYKCPHDRHVLILANKNAHAGNSVINIQKLASGNFTAREEYIGSDIKVVDGKFDICVPARSFRIVAFPLKAFYPVNDDMSRMWETWTKKGDKADFNLDTRVGHDQNGCLKAEIQGDACFMKHFPVKPGEKYCVLVYVKRKTPGWASITFQGRDDKSKFLSPLQTTRINVDSDWQKLELHFTVPNGGDWDKCHSALITLSGENGTIWFDDFSMEEK
jgi:hypothetical protein